MEKPLIIPVNGVYFDQIARGEKPEEYRLVNDYWVKRLVGRSYSAVVMTRGYPKAGGVEGVTRLTRKWKGWTAKMITHPHFGNRSVMVYAIDVSEAARPNNSSPNLSGSRCCFRPAT